MTTIKSASLRAHQVGLAFLRANVMTSTLLAPRLEIEITEEDFHIMVERRCAMMIEVRPRRMETSASCKAPTTLRYQQPSTQDMSCSLGFSNSEVRRIRMLTAGPKEARGGEEWVVALTWILASVRLSRALVASSSSRIAGFFRMVRANATRCFSPPLSRSPLSPTTVAYPCMQHIPSGGGWARCHCYIHFSPVHLCR